MENARAQPAVPARIGDVRKLKCMSSALALASVLAAGVAALGPSLLAQDAAAEPASTQVTADREPSPSGKRATTAASDGATSDSDALTEIRALRRAVDQQSKQLDAIAQQLARVHQQLDGGTSGADAAAPAPSNSKLPVPVPTASASANNAGDTPKAEPIIAAAVPGPKHPVAKGETLTSIAKRYNIPISELQKANNIKDDRKLQIGQVLHLPASSMNPQQPSDPSTYTDPKENR